MTACSGSSGSRGSVAPVDAQGVTSTAPASAPSVTSSAGSATTTSTTLASTTTTAAPRPRPLAVTRTVLPDDTEHRSYREVRDAVGGLPNHVVVAVGAQASVPGGEQRAAVYALRRGEQRQTTIELPGERAGSSSANAIAAADGVVVVAGAAEQLGVERPVVWFSNDDLTTFSASLPWPEQAGFAVAAGVLDGDLLAVAELSSPSGIVLSMARRHGDAWSTHPIPIDGRSAEAFGMAVSNGVIVVTGRVERAGHPVALVWHSADGGATFIVDALGDGYRAISAPGNGPSGLVAVGTRAADGRPDLLTSTDGIVWVPAEIAVTRSDGSSVALTDSAPPNIVSVGDAFAFGVVDVLASVAIVRTDGTGVIGTPAYRTGEEVYLKSPVVAGDDSRLLAITTGSTTFRIGVTTVQSGSTTTDGWAWPDLDSVNAVSRPAVTGATLGRTSNGVVAAVSTYPHVTAKGSGSTWRPNRTWAASSDGVTFSPLDAAAISDRVRQVATDGAHDLAVALVSDDPADDGSSGPRGGTAVQTRAAGGTWSEPVLVVSGVGGDEVQAVAFTGVGWVLAGTHIVTSADGSYTDHPALMVGDGAIWAEAAIEGVTGEASLTGVVGSPAAGPVLVVGWQRNDKRDWVALVLARRSDGVWVSVPLASSTGLSLYGGVADGAGVDLLGRAGDDTVIYHSADGLSFERRVVNFAVPAETFPYRLLATAGGTRVIVGSVWHGDVTRLAVWTSADGVSWSERELSGGDASPELAVREALLVGSTVVVAGTVRRQGIAWTIALDG